jgi:hypothetical protein
MASAWGIPIDALKLNPLLPYHEVLEHSMHTEDLYAYEELSDAETIPLDQSVNHSVDTAFSRVDNTNKRNREDLLSDDAESTYTRHNRRVKAKERKAECLKDQTHKYKRRSTDC